MKKLGIHFAFKYISDFPKIQPFSSLQNRLVDDTRKSASLQMLAHGDGALPPMNTPANEMVGTEIGDGRTKSCSERNGAKAGGGGKLSRQQSSTTDWHTSERIGGKISVELAHESSANNSGGRGSRSSGLQVNIFNG